ncbi:MAG: metallophosphoesterase family protein [Bdellovibrionota bacterium]
MFLKLRLRPAHLLLAFLPVIGCGKNLLEMFAHPTVESRVADSLSGALAVPAAMTPADPTNFNFAVFADVQVRPENKTLLSRFTQDVGPKNISFFVVLGDLTEDGLNDEFTKIKTALDGVGIPYSAAIGNHDLFQEGSDGGWNRWKTVFGSSTYSVTIAGAVRLILLDTSSGEIGPSQFDWLQGQLTQPSPPPFTIVGSHYPIYDGITPMIWRLSSAAERYKLTGMLNQYGVYAYVGGHIHEYRQSQVASVLHLTVGSMYPYGLDYGNHGYVLFTYNHGAMSWQWVPFPDVP